MSWLLKCCISTYRKIKLNKFLEKYSTYIVIWGPIGCFDYRVKDFGPVRLLRWLRSPQPPRLPALTDAQRKVPGMLPAPPQQPPGGGREPAQGNLGVVVLVPLHLHPRPLSISRLVESSVSPCFLCLPQGFTSAPGLINIGASQPSPGYPLLTLDQWFSKCGTQTYSFGIIWELGRIANYPSHRGYSVFTVLKTLGMEPRNMHFSSPSRDSEVP